jgi:hypothetical protein
MQTLHVEVKEEDLRLEYTNPFTDCMGARAISRALGRSVNVAISTADYLDANGAMIVLHLPKIASDNISAWCNKQPLEPFSFDLLIPSTTDEIKAATC